MPREDAWPQDDLAARAALLEYLEGRLPLEQAAEKYASCFPPAAGMDAQHIQRTWRGWNSAMRERLARQIRRAMEAEP